MLLLDPGSMSGTFAGCKAGDTLSHPKEPFQPSTNALNAVRPLRISDASIPE